MTQGEFLNAMDDLLHKYCVNNSDYANVNLKTNIRRSENTSVNILLSTYCIWD